MRYLIKATVFVPLIALMLTMTSCLRDEGGPSSPEGDSSTSLQESAPQSTESETEKPTPPPVVIGEEEMIWIDAHESSGDVIMSAEDIAAECDRMADESPRVYDILSFDTAERTPDKIRADIEAYGAPPAVGYDREGRLIDEAHKSDVMKKRNMEGIGKHPVKRGIVTARANLRSFPDNKPYRKTANNQYDSIQQTELHFATPVLVLHHSLDGKYYFVESYNYKGWVDSTRIAVTDDVKLWESIAKPESYVRITATSVYLANHEVDMGVKLPLLRDRGDRYDVTIPLRRDDGTLATNYQTVRAEYATIGDLTYTYENFIVQAFKYKGVMYSWGGLDHGVDCSGFISNVMRTFGFMLPRDTKDQQSVVGTAQDVRGKSHGEIGAILAETSAPTAVYTPGHVLFYLGYDVTTGQYSFIHAPQIGESVSVTTKTDLSAVTYICEFKNR